MSFGSDPDDVDLSDLWYLVTHATFEALKISNIFG
jgi:hypothetical protein